MTAAPGGALERVQGEALKVASPKHSENTAAISMLREKMQKQGARAAIEAARENRSVGVNVEDTMRAVNSNLHDGDPSIQADKRNNAIDSINKSNKFLHEDYDKLKPGEKKDYQNQVIDRVKSTGWMQELYKGMPNDADKRAFADSLLKDPSVRAEVNKRTQELVGKRITEGMKQEKAAQLRDEDPSLSETDAHLKAAGLLEEQYQRDLANIVPDAVSAVFDKNLDVADKMVQESDTELDEAATQKLAADGKALDVKVMRQFEDRFKNPNARPGEEDKGVYAQAKFGFGKDGLATTQFNEFMNKGLDGLFPNIGGMRSAEIQAIMDDPELRAKYEAQLGQALVAKRMRAGGLSTEEMYKLADAPWMGETQDARVQKLESIILNHKKLQGLIENGQADGTVSKDFITKLKAASPAARIGLLAMLAALIALPVGLPVAAGFGAVGSALGIGARYVDQSLGS